MKIKKNNNNKKIIIKGAREHNLKNLSFEIPRNKLVVFTGVSGSGKSSLVFNTIYAEGQRRYVESLSSYARQFLERINKPDVDYIQGISPAVAIEQKKGIKNSRSTVGTSTEVYDYLRLLFARVGKTICFQCGNEVKKDTTSTVIKWLNDREEGEKYYLTFPLREHKGRTVKEELELLKKRGFFRIFNKGKIIDLNIEYSIPRRKANLRVIIDRFKIIKEGMREKLFDSIEVTFKEGENRLTIINAATNEEQNFNKFYECCGIRYEEPEPRFFSFNNPFGACPVCQGFSKVIGIDMNLVIPKPELSISEGAIAPFRSEKFGIHLRTLIQNVKEYGIPLNKPFNELKDDQVSLIRRGFGGYKGIDNFFEKLERKSYKMHIRVLLSRYRGYTLCSACKGSRLRREALQVKVGGKSIYEIVQLPIEKSLKYFNRLKLSEYDLKIGDRILQEIIKRLTFLNNVGIGYLSLDRQSSTLSGGETQRINLATSLGSSLVGTLYVLDEPSIGLHPRDNSRLIKILKNLRDIGNTVLVIEHEPEMIKEADLIIDMGPKAGEYGGEIVSMGTYKDILQDTNSLTGKYLSGKMNIPVPQTRNIKQTNEIKIFGARENNLKNLDVNIPLNKFVVITGVSGSGKSTLVYDILYNGLSKTLGMPRTNTGAYDKIEGAHFLDEVEIVNQSPIGKSPRSNPISYIKAFEHIRDLFAHTHQARTRGYKPGYFSFNVPGGRCETCAGDGFIKVEMQFLADLYLTCEECGGTRFKKEIREITYKDKNLVDVLNMTVNEAVKFFEDEPKILKFIKLLDDVGLGYIKLGQPSNTLSGGEAQRVKLASHLSRQRERKHTLFLFDEPTTGLHFYDIDKLLTCFNLLIERGNSVLIIEHNLDIIKCADFIIDLGPEAGEKGGEIVAMGTPEEIAADEKSLTGKYLRSYLN
ncbi:MAG: excinuclease ABC subunit UvrA [Bacteroidetes bacterium]|nr:excinuclease ABC subunit UvrA [Bacteroidota bacterium]